MSKNALLLTTRDFELLDAGHLASELRKHFDILKLAGLKEAEIRDFEAVIADATKHNKIDQIAAQTSLDQSRFDSRERLGEFRRWSGVVARLPTGVDKTAWKALKLDVEFPTDDGQMAAFMTGLDAAMRKYSARLAARSFTREKQQGLLDAYEEFVKVGKEVVAEKSTRKTDARARNSAFVMLRSYVRSYRELGLAAFHGTAGESDFRRLAKVKSTPAVQTTKAEKAAAKAAAVAAKADAKAAEAAAKAAARKAKSAKPLAPPALAAVEVAKKVG